MLTSVANVVGTHVLSNSGMTTSTSLAQHVSHTDGLADVSSVLWLLYFCIIE